MMRLMTFIKNTIKRFLLWLKRWKWLRNFVIWSQMLLILIRYLRFLRLNLFRGKFLFSLSSRVRNFLLFILCFFLQCLCIILHCRWFKNITFRKRRILFRNYSIILSHFNFFWLFLITLAHKISNRYVTNKIS